MSSVPSEDMKEQWKCLLCSTVRSSSRKLEGHMHLKHSQEEEQVKVEEAKKEVRKPRKNIRKLPVGARAQCPECEKNFCNSYTCQRHLETVHKVDPKLYKISNTRKACYYCGRSISAMAKHLKTCKSKRIEVNKRTEEKKMERRKVNEIHFVSGGHMLVEKVDLYMKRKTYHQRTLRQYKNKIKSFIKFCEEKSVQEGNPFLADHVLYGLEKGVNIPAIHEYLEEGESLVGGKLTALKAYKVLCSFLTEYFGKVYNRVQGTAEASQRDLMILRVSEMKRSCDLDLKRLNREASRKTHETNSMKQTMQEETNWKPEKLWKCVEELISSDRVKEMIQKMKKAKSLDDLQDLGGEVACRNMIMSCLLLLGNGQRGGTVVNMKIEEFKSAVKKEGFRVVKVGNHKTSSYFSGACVSFALPGLYKATQNYIKLTQEDKGPSSFVFTTQKKKQASMRAAVNWLKTNVLKNKDFLSNEQLSRLSAKGWRKGWAKWGKSHPDEKIRNISNIIMCHTKEVAQGHYIGNTADEAAHFTRAVIGSKGAKLEAESEEEEDHNPVQASHSVTGRSFSTLENKLLKKCFWKDGKKPLRFLQGDIDRMKEENNQFAQLYAQLLNKKVGLKNPRNAARNTIRKAIM